MNQTAGIRPVRFVRAVLLGCAVSLGILLALCMAAAALFTAGTIPERGLLPVSWLICALGGFAGCRFAVYSAGQLRLPASLGCALATMLLLALAQLLAFRTPAVMPGVTVAVFGAAALLAALTGAGRKPGRRRKRR